MKNSADKRVLILSLSGIGNFLMHTPAFKILKQTHPGWHITVAVAPRGTRELAEHSQYIDHVLELSLKQPVLKHVQTLRHLQNHHFDVALMLSPGQRIKGAAYMFLAGIPQRIAHEYPFAASQHSSFLLTDSVPENISLHDIEQNLQLLKFCEVSLPAQSNYELTVPVAHQKEAQDVLSELKVPRDKTLIGFHMGSNKGFEWKRWPFENFIALGKELIAKEQAHILLFGGPEEDDLKATVEKALAPSATSITHPSLLTTAALMQLCDLFISNDSGLMHLAAAAGVETYGLFGPTDENQTGPRGVKSYVIRAEGTKPVYATEKGHNLGQESHETIQKITPESVLGQLTPN